MRPTLKLTAFATLDCPHPSWQAATTSAPMEPERRPAPADPGARPARPDGEPLPTTPAPLPRPVANYSGVYDVVAPLDFTQNGVLPGHRRPALGGAHRAARSPRRGALHHPRGRQHPVRLGPDEEGAQLPGDAAVEALLDDLITKNVYQGYPVVDQVTGIISGIAEVSKYMDVHDTITVHKPDATGRRRSISSSPRSASSFLGNTRWCRSAPASMCRRAAAHDRQAHAAHQRAGRRRRSHARRRHLLDAGRQPDARGARPAAVQPVRRRHRPRRRAQEPGALRDFGQTIVDELGRHLIARTTGQARCATARSAWSPTR